MAVAAIKLFAANMTLMHVKKSFVFFSTVTLGANRRVSCFKLVAQLSLKIHLGGCPVAIGTLQSAGGLIDPVVQHLVSIGHYPFIRRIDLIIHIVQTAFDGFNNITGNF